MYVLLDEHCDKIHYLADTPDCKKFIKKLIDSWCEVVFTITWSVWAVCVIILFALKLSNICLRILACISAVATLSIGISGYNNIDKRTDDISYTFGIRACMNEYWPSMAISSLSKLNDARVIWTEFALTSLERIKEDNVRIGDINNCKPCGRGDRTFATLYLQNAEITTYITTCGGQLLSRVKRYWTNVSLIIQQLVKYVNGIRRDICESVNSWCENLLDIIMSYIVNEPQDYGAVR